MSTATVGPALVRAPASPDFELYRGSEGLRALAPAWAAVLRSVEAPEFFHLYEWYEAVLHIWPEEASNILFFLASHAGRPVAICPLQLTRTRLGGVPVRVLAPPDPNAISYSDFVCARTQDGAALLTALRRHLRGRHDVGWDLLTLPRMLATAGAARGTIPPPHGFFHYPREQCFYLPVDTGADSILAGLSILPHLRRYRRKLAQESELEFVTSRDAAQLPQLFEEFLALEASGWKGASGEGTAIKLDDALTAFYSRVMALFAARGACEINLLRVNGRAIAGQYCLLSAGRWYHLKIAYDESYHRFSPGGLLLEQVLRTLCGDAGIHTASLLTGAAWAERWHPRAIPVGRLVAGSGTAAGWLALQQIRLRRFLRERRAALLSAAPRRTARAGATAASGA